MENFYKITKAQADILTRFEYSPGCAFDPYVCEQKDGTYLVSEIMYNLLKDTPQFKQVNFTQATKISTQQVDEKPVVIGTKTQTTQSK